MKDLRELNPYRVKNPFVEAMLSLSNPRNSGIFEFKRNGAIMHVIASVDGGREHVSVSFENKVLSEKDIEWLAKQFFKPEELDAVYEGPPGMPEAHTRHLWRRP
mgnify:FL=1